MTINLKHIAALFVVIILLIAANAYQFQNPKVLEVPAGPEEIDSTAWVQRSAYLHKSAIIDSLEGQNKALAKRVKGMSDEIASYSAITGKLRVQKDSLENELNEWHKVPEMKSAESLTSDDQSFLEKAREDAREMQALMDSGLVLQRVNNMLPDGMIPASSPKRFIKERQFGNGLFIVTGIVEFIDYSFRQHLKLEQIRDIRLDVVTTMNKDQSRVLTYVTSPDFESLEYRSYTQLQQKNKLPKFWIGVATGAAVLTGITILVD